MSIPHGAVSWSVNITITNLKIYPFKIKIISFIIILRLPYLIDKSKKGTTLSNDLFCFVMREASYGISDQVVYLIVSNPDL